MGLPMAARLAESASFAVRGYDRNEPRRMLAASAGVTTSTTVTQTTDGAEVIVLSVRDGPQAEQVLFGDGVTPPALRRGSTVILTSTIRADHARLLADRLLKIGVRMVDAPVSGGPGRARAGDLLILVGAPVSDVQGARPVLEQLSSTLTVVGERVGDGQLVKVINQLLAGVHIAAAAEAIALAAAVGLDPRVVVDTLTSGAGASFMLQDRGPRMLEALSSEPEVRARVDIFVKDMSLVRALAEEAHVPVIVANAAGALYEIAHLAGLGASDDSTIVRMLTERKD
jgi:3-hydroxyisobutyrate dehydrogenase